MGKQTDKHHVELSYKWNINLTMGTNPHSSSMELWHVNWNILPWSNLSISDFKCSSKEKKNYIKGIMKKLYILLAKARSLNWMSFCIWGEKKQSCFDVCPSIPFFKFACYCLFILKNLSNLVQFFTHGKSSKAFLRLDSAMHYWKLYV